MRRAMWLSVMPLVGIALGACAGLQIGRPSAAPAAPAPAPSAPAAGHCDAEAEVAKARDEFTVGYRERSVDKLTEVFAENAFWAGTEHPFWMEGRAAIRANWIRFFNRYPTAEIGAWHTVSRHYNSRADIGYFTMWMPDRAGQFRVIHGRFSRLWVSTDKGCKIGVLHISQFPETR